MAGAEWLDFTLADKGTGLTQLCAALGVELDQANTAAYIVTTRKGAIRSMPERGEVEALLGR